MNQTELLRFLEEIGARPKKRLSQNFLIDGNIVRKIVQLAEVQPGDQVLEIGPGPGALTEELLARGASVLAVEKDPLFARHLERFQTPDKRLEVHCDDILRYELPHTRYKVVANLPYHITTPILEKLFECPFHSITIMIQKEVADRIRAKPSTKEFGSLTLFLQFYSTLHSSFTVSASCFYPRPSVDSTVLRLNSRPLPDIDPNQLFPLIRKAYQQRRKTLVSSLRSLYPNLSSTLEALHLSTKARPEELTLEQWISLAHLLQM
ncbi:MAG: ribosomal RNA small subunit methyltransferase A [Verrucomicrobiota bacterium]|nr:ribosomal RNA small subunit methyltransferase A [Verrucomicrobiota bacterium]